jgi:hypothetical protein
MRLTMDSLGGFGVRRMDKAEGGAIALIEPIGHVFDAMSVLNIDVPAVRLSDILSLHAAQIVAVHENRHVFPQLSQWLGHIAGRSHLRRTRFGLPSPLTTMGLLATAIGTRVNL